MASLKITSEKERSAHPHVKLINAYLLKRVFDNTLSEQELKVLESGNISDVSIDSLSNKEKRKLFICFLLSENNRESSQEIVDLAVEILGLSIKEIVKCATLAENREIIQLEQEHLTESELKDILSRKQVLLNASPIYLDFILNYKLSSEIFIRDYLVTADFQYVYSHACQNGYSDVIAYIEAIEGFDKKAAASANDYAAYRYACQNAHSDVIAHIEAIEGSDKKAAASAYGYYAYRLACQNGHSDVIKHLLHEKNTFLYTESHDIEYGPEYIYDFVRTKLKQLTIQKELFYERNPDGVFNVPDDEAQYYIAILRNLIRRGVSRDYASAENLNDEIIALLEIPAVKSFCHQRISENGQGDVSESMNI